MDIRLFAHDLVLRPVHGGMYSSVIAYLAQRKNGASRFRLPSNQFRSIVKTLDWLLQLFL